MVVQKRTVKCPSETAQSLRDNLIIVCKYLQGKNTEHWTNGWELQTDKLKLKWGTIFLKVRLINHWNKGSAWILIVLQSSNHGWMSFLKVKHNLWDSERSNQQNPNDLLNRVCQNNHRIFSFLLFNSIMWSPIFYWKLLSRGLISGPHLSKSPSHQTRNSEAFHLCSPLKMTSGFSDYSCWYQNSLCIVEFFLHSLKNEYQWCLMYIIQYKGFLS